MKALLTPIVLVAGIGCSSSSDSPVPNGPDDIAPAGVALIGTWLSNCHELLGTEDASGNNVYNISEITFTESEYVDRFVTYTDVNCTTNPFEESGSFSYTVGDRVSTTDGVEATRITITPIIPDRPDLALSFEGIFRIAGVELNLACSTKAKYRV